MGQWLALAPIPRAGGGWRDTGAAGGGCGEPGPIARGGLSPDGARATQGHRPKVNHNTKVLDSARRGGAGGSHTAYTNIATNAWYSHICYHSLNGIGVPKSAARLIYGCDPSFRNGMLPNEALSDSSRLVWWAAPCLTRPTMPSASRPVSPRWIVACGSPRAPAGSAESA